VQKTGKAENHAIALVRKSSEAKPGCTELGFETLVGCATRRR